MASGSGVAADEVGDPAGDVDRMVAEALEVAADQGHLHGDGDADLPRHELGGEAHLQVVELVVGLLEPVGGEGISLDVGVGGCSPHLDADASHLLYQASDARRQLSGNPPRRRLGDVLGEVVAALQFGHDTKGGQQEPEVARHRRLQRELMLHKSFHVEAGRVDGALVAVAQLARRLSITGEKRFGRGCEPLSDEREQLDDLLVDLLEISVKRRSQLLGHAGSSSSVSPAAVPPRAYRWQVRRRGR